MRITVEIPKRKKYKPIEIADAVYQKDFKIKIFFQDGTVQVVDFKPFVFKPFGHPIYKRYRKPSVFKKFEIIDGNLNWFDYEMIFPVEQLYAGKIL